MTQRQSQEVFSKNTAIIFCAYRLCSASIQIENLANSQKRLGSPYGGAVTALAVTERALLSPLRGHLSHRERQGRLRRQCAKFQFAVPQNDTERVRARTAAQIRRTAEKCGGDSKNPCVAGRIRV